MLSTTIDKILCVMGPQEIKMSHVLNTILKLGFFFYFYGHPPPLNFQLFPTETTWGLF